MAHRHQQEDAAMSWPRAPWRRWAQRHRGQPAVASDVDLVDRFFADYERRGAFLKSFDEFEAVLTVLTSARVAPDFVSRMDLRDHVDYLEKQKILTTEIRNQWA